MPYDIVRLDYLLLVLLYEPPTETSIAALLARIVQASEEAGRRLIYISVIPDRPIVLGPELRTAMTAFARQVSTLCEEVHLVVKTKGFPGTILRSAITAVAAVTRERNLSVHRTLAEALATVRPSFGVHRARSIDALLTRFESAA